MAPLVVGVPKEIKDSENRVAVQPDGVAELVYHGHRVLVETEAGTGSRFSDAEYAAATSSTPSSCLYRQGTTRMNAIRWHRCA